MSGVLWVGDRDIPSSRIAYGSIESEAAPWIFRGLFASFLFTTFLRFEYVLRPIVMLLLVSNLDCAYAKRSVDFLSSTRRVIGAIDCTMSADQRIV